MLKSIFKKFSEREVIESPRNQTEWLSEFFSYRAEKSMFGRWSIYTCAYYPLSVATEEWAERNKHRLQAGTFKVFCDGQEIECRGIKGKEPVAKSLIKKEVLAFFKEQEAASIEAAKFVAQRKAALKNDIPPRSL